MKKTFKKIGSELLLISLSISITFYMVFAILKCINLFNLDDIITITFTQILGMLLLVKIFKSRKNISKVINIKKTFKKQLEERGFDFLKISGFIVACYITYSVVNF